MKFCFYNRALSADENAWNNDHPGLPVTRDIVLWLPLNEGSNNSFDFTSGNSYTITVTAYSLDGGIYTKTFSVVAA